MATALKLKVSIGLALAASLASVFLGYLLVGHFIMATLTWAGILDPQGEVAWYPAVYYLTHSWMTHLLIGWALLVIALGMIGRALAGRDPARRKSSGLSSIAARFAILGLLGGGLDAVLVAILLFVGRFWLWWV
jgi:hypothetical protein